MHGKIDRNLCVRDDVLQSEILPSILYSYIKLQFCIRQLYLLVTVSYSWIKNSLRKNQVKGIIDPRVKGAPKTAQVSDNLFRYNIPIVLSR